MGVPNYFTLVTMAVLLILLAITETLDQRRRDRKRV
jgi:simple sugar transport system permease protein